MCERPLYTLYRVPTPWPCITESKCCGVVTHARHLAGGPLLDYMVLFFDRKEMFVPHFKVRRLEGSEFENVLLLWRKK